MTKPAPAAVLDFGLLERVIESCADADELDAELEKIGLVLRKRSSRRVETMKGLLEEGRKEIDSLPSGHVEIHWRGRTNLKLHVSREVASAPAPGFDVDPVAEPAEPAEFST